MNSWLLLLLGALTMDCYAVVIRSVQLHSVRQNKTIIVLHDIHRGQNTIVASQVAFVQQFTQLYPQATLIIEAPPPQDAPLVQIITECIKDIAHATETPNASLPDHIQTFLQTQKTAGTLTDKTLLSALSNMCMQSTAICCDHRAFLFALSDLIALFPTVQTLLKNRSVLAKIKSLSITTNHLINHIQTLEQQLKNIEPVITRMTAQLISDDYAPCLSNLRHYRKCLEKMAHKEENIFAHHKLAGPIIDFFSWLMTSHTLCNVLLEATFIDHAQTIQAPWVIIITGAYHAERLQTFFQSSGFTPISDSGINYNGTVTHLSYTNMLMNLAAHNHDASIDQLLQILFSAIGPLEPNHLFECNPKQDNKREET